MMTFSMALVALCFIDCVRLGVVFRQCSELASQETRAIHTHLAGFEFPRAMTVGLGRIWMS